MNLQLKIHALYALYCRYRIKKLVPELLSEIDSYSLKTKSTGTKLSTLYRAIKIILKKNQIIF